MIVLLIIIIIFCSQVFDWKMLQITTTNSFSQFLRYDAFEDEVSSIMDPQITQCTPIDRIYMTRVHKTGSTTLLNVMYRFMYKNDLKTAMLKTEVVRPSFTKPEMFILPPGEEPDLGNLHFWGEHGAYNKTDADRILGVGSFKIASVRHPLSQLRSAFSEWNLGREMKDSNGNKVSTGGDPVSLYLDELSKGNDLLPEKDRWVVTRSCFQNHYFFSNFDGRYLA